jgi:hypothetical protein
VKAECAKQSQTPAALGGALEEGVGIDVGEHMRTVPRRDGRPVTDSTHYGPIACSAVRERNGGTNEGRLSPGLHQRLDLQQRRHEVRRRHLFHRRTIVRPA